MIQFQQQQPQQSMKQHTRSNINSENCVMTPITLIQQLQQPIQLNKIAQCDVKSPMSKKEQQLHGKINKGKNENLGKSQEDEDDDGFHINLYAKSIPKNKISQQTQQGDRKNKKTDEKTVKKDTPNGVQQSVASTGSVSMQRQLSNQSVQFLQAQLARQEASAASSLIDIQKLKYLTQLEKLLPTSNNNNNSISNTNLLKNKFEKDQEEEDRSQSNLSAHKSVSQQSNPSSITNAYQNNLNHIPKNGDLGDILAEKMKLIEDRKKSTQIESKQSKDEVTFQRNNNNSSTKMKTKKRMSLKTESRKTRRSFACKHSRSAKSQQRLSISFDLYSIKESKSEESADGSPLEAQNSSNNIKRGFGARSFFSKVTSTEQLIPLINSQHIIDSQNNQDDIKAKDQQDNEDEKVKIISTFNLPPNEQGQDSVKNDADQNGQGNSEVFTKIQGEQEIQQQQVNQIFSSLEIDKQKSQDQDQMDQIKVKSDSNTNTNTNNDSNIISDKPREPEQQVNKTQENVDDLRIQDLKLPIQVIENASIQEIALPNNQRDNLLRCKDESSPKENGLINLYRKNEKEEKQDTVIAQQNGQKQQLNQINTQQQQQQSNINNSALGQSGSLPVNSTSQMDNIKGINNSQTVENNIKSEVNNRITENKTMIQQQVIYSSIRNNQSPKQDRQVNNATSSKSPLHYMQLELKQLLPINSKQGQLRKQSEVKVILFNKSDEKEDTSKTLKRRSSLLDREQDNSQIPLKTEGCQNVSKDQRNNFKYIIDQDDQDNQNKQYSNKNYAYSPQQINRRSNLQIESQFEADRQLLRNSIPQSVQSSGNYTSSYKDQFKQRQELQNIRKNPPNYNLQVYIAGDKKKENQETKQDSACSSPKTVDKSKNKVSQQQQQPQQLKGIKQDKAGSEQSSAKGSSEISSPKLASRIQVEKNKLSVIALQQKIMQQLGKAGVNKRTANTESEEIPIDLQSPVSNNNIIKSPNSSSSSTTTASDKRTIKTIGNSSNSHYYGHNSAGIIQKQCDSVDSQATRIIKTNYDTEPTNDQDNRQSSQKRIPLTIHVSDFTRGNALAGMNNVNGSQSSIEKTDIMFSKQQQSPSVVPANKNMNLIRSTKEDNIEKTSGITTTTIPGLSSLKALPTKLPSTSQKQFPVPTRSEVSMKKQLIVRPLVLDEQPPKKKSSNKFNVESKVKNYILAGQSSQQQGYSKAQTSSTVQMQQQVRDIQDVNISQGNGFSTEQESAKNQLKNIYHQQQQQQQNEYYSQFQLGTQGNSKQQIRSPQIQESQQQLQQSYSILQSDQQSTSLNRSVTITSKGSTHQTGNQLEYQQDIDSKQRQYLSLQLTQQIIAPSEEAPVRQQRQPERQHSQWST